MAKHVSAREATGIDPLALLDVKDEVLAEYEGRGQNGDNDDRLPVMNPTDTGGFRRSILADFIEAQCNVRAEPVESATRIYQRFTLWHMTTYNIKAVPSHRKYGNLFGNHFQRFKNGPVYYRGVRLKKERHLRAV